MNVLRITGGAPEVSDKPTRVWNRLANATVTVELNGIEAAILERVLGHCYGSPGKLTGRHALYGAFERLVSGLVDDLVPNRDERWALLAQLTGVVQAENKLYVTEGGPQ